MVNILFIVTGGTRYPEACVSLGLEHRLHSPYEKSILERTIEYLKDSTEAFDDYYPCMKAGLCNLRHVHKWLVLFVFMHNTIVKSRTKFDIMRRWICLSYQHRIRNKKAYHRLVKELSKGALTGGGPPLQASLVV